MGNRASGKWGGAFWKLEEETNDGARPGELCVAIIMLQMWKGV